MLLQMFLRGDLNIRKTRALSFNLFLYNIPLPQTPLIDSVRSNNPKGKVPTCLLLERVNAPAIAPRWAKSASLHQEPHSHTNLPPTLVTETERSASQLHSFIQSFGSAQLSSSNNQHSTRSIDSASSSSLLPLLPPHSLPPPPSPPSVLQFARLTASLCCTRTLLQVQSEQSSRSIRAASVFVPAFHVTVIS